jgi:hypothetical protein
MLRKHSVMKMHYYSPPESLDSVEWYSYGKISFEGVVIDFAAVVAATELVVNVEIIAYFVVAEVAVTSALVGQKLVVVRKGW